MTTPSSVKPIGANSQPVFPCWIYHPGNKAEKWEWARFECEGVTEGDWHLYGWTHWLPDGPEPTEIPTDTPTPSALPADRPQGIEFTHPKLKLAEKDLFALRDLLVDANALNASNLTEMFCLISNIRGAMLLAQDSSAPAPSPDKSAGGTTTLSGDPIQLTDREALLICANSRKRLLEELAQAQQSLAEAEHETHRMREKFGRAESSVVEASIYFPNVGDYIAQLESQLSARSQELAEERRMHDEIVENQCKEIHAHLLTIVTLQAAGREVRSSLAQLKQERDGLVGRIEVLTKRLEWVNEPLKGHETAEHIKKLYHSALLNHVHDESEIKEMVRPYLTEFELEGDSYGVPDFVDWVRLIVARLASPSSSPGQQGGESERLREHIAIGYGKAAQLDKEFDRLHVLVDSLACHLNQNKGL